MPSGYARVNDADLYYDQTGEGSSVVFVHGSMVDHRMWDDQVSAFNDYKVIRYDLRGYGRSSKPPGPYSNHEDLKGLLDFLGVQKAHLVGLSMGGGTALNFALAFPERVKTLIVVPGGIGGYQLPAEFEKGFDAIASTAKSGDSKRAIELLWEFAPMLTAAKTPAVRRKLDQMLADYSWVHFRTADDRKGLTPPAAQQITNLQPPLLIVQGKLEVSYFQELGRWMQLKAPKAERLEIPNGGHMVNMEQPEAFNRAVLDFLRQYSD